MLLNDLSSISAFSLSFSLSPSLPLSSVIPTVPHQPPTVAHTLSTTVSPYVSLSLHPPPPSLASFVIYQEEKAVGRVLLFRHTLLDHVRIRGGRCRHCAGRKRDRERREGQRRKRDEKRESKLSDKNKTSFSSLSLLRRRSFSSGNRLAHRCAERNPLSPAHAATARPFVSFSSPRGTSPKETAQRDASFSSSFTPVDGAACACGAQPRPQPRPRLRRGRAASSLPLLHRAARSGRFPPCSIAIAAA